tara:strand:+ start:1660 stop:1968 length:309 start_codon:yes stop_codon:yes gene_type:complete
MGPNSYLSTNVATPAEIKPHRGMEGSPAIPTYHPIGALTMNMKTFPMALFDLLRITAFLTTPVTPSPKAMNNDGMMASQGSPTNHQINDIEVHHMKANFTSF